MTLPSPEKQRASGTLNPLLQISPGKEEEREEMEDVREPAEEVEGEAEKPPRPRVVVPDDYVNRENIVDWVEQHWDANFAKVEQAKRLMAETDMCGFCEFNCPAPSQLENDNQFHGCLDSLWDHIEINHPLAWEWLG